MDMVALIIKKRDGGTLTPEEIRWFVDGVTNNSIPDYQIAAMLMAMFLRGMDPDETAALTLCMADSGGRIDLSAIPGIKTDKHSTGGVADTTTLILVPLVASCGVPVVKMSGRGLGFTGGTLDKLESIPGFRIGLSADEAVRICRETGAVIMGQSDGLCPADKKLYALRDVTGTVNSIPLIAASIMSKKIAAGADAIVLDVKCGNGAFMQTLEEARALSRTMVRIGRAAGRRVAAVITGMDQPLGTHIGNALEVIEAIDTLQGKAAGDLLDVTLTIGAHMLMLAGKATGMEDAREQLSLRIRNGEGLEKLRGIIRAQGGNPAVCDNTGLLPHAVVVETVPADRDGYVHSMDTAGLGNAFVRLGGGRLSKDQPIDPAAGMILHFRIGDRVRRGDPLASVHGATGDIVLRGVRDTASCIRISEDRPAVPAGILDIISG
ncbi:MAG: thymidine phosphorylase [Clostridia bacterium]|nr:thymidine phosphorylase [Clostridia bacterium]